METAKLAKCVYRQHESDETSSFKTMSKTRQGKSKYTPGYIKCRFTSNKNKHAEHNVFVRWIIKCQEHRFRNIYITKNIRFTTLNINLSSESNLKILYEPYMCMYFIKSVISHEPHNNICALLLILKNYTIILNYTIWIHT